MRFLAYLVASAGLVHAATVVQNWNIGYLQANPDGLKERQVIGVNGQWPPAPVNVTLNDTLVLNVYNQLDIPTSIHFHGMFMNNTGYMDGANMVTQCPIPAGYNFTYEFPIQQTGTYWIHSHYGGQYMDGLRTAFVLHNPNEPYTYDEEMIVTLSDWYHDSSEINLQSFMSVYNPTGAEPVPQSGLINDNANSTFDFVPGKTYRLRIINVSGFATFFFSIDGHQLDIIETDGTDTQRTTVDSLYLTAAQRISVLVTAKNATNVNYYMHADMSTDMFDTVPDTLQPNITAPIYYNRSSSSFASSQDVGMGSTFDDIAIPPLQPLNASQPTQTLNLTFDFAVTTDGINRGMFNDLPYLSPKVPSLNTMLTMGSLANNTDVYGPQGRAFILDHLDVVDIVINNLDTGKHPFHLHGHHFQIVARGDGVYDGNASTVDWHVNNPTKRDTVLVPAGSYTIIRFSADNPGVWFFHCHIEWHLETGLAATMVEAPFVAQQRMTLPQSFNDLCTANDIPSSGNAAGKAGLDLNGAPSGITPIPDAFTPRGEGAMAGCILSALLGMGTMVWYAVVDPEKTAKALAASRM